ncbi:hypothetical protein OAP18_02035 [Gammaproteobacteria bacterium]|nr:hypothetical protein [Gammaproteobacteria bacterium]
MKRRDFNQSLLTSVAATSLTGLSASLTAAEPASTYTNGNLISPDIFVSDKQGSNISLRSLFGDDSDIRLNVLYIFGGGDMGSGQTGHLWCQDSFEDSHILRTLVGKYQDQGVKFIPVAAAPVYHSEFLGFPARVFLDEDEASEAFKQAEQAFIDSTLAAFESGILPIEPYFDSRLRLMMNRSAELLPGSAYGDIAPWQGAFRAADETQFYGVPSFWVISNDGQIMAEPLRGNIYHPHGGKVNINYSFSDLDALLQGLL